MKLINPNQIRALRTAASRIFPACDCKGDHICDYHDWLATNFDGIGSTKDMNASDASEAITMLAELTGYKQKPRYDGQGFRGDAGGWLTQAQANKIHRLQRKLKWDDKRTRGFIRRQLGEPKSPSWLRSYEATKVITGLMKMAGER